MILLDYSQSAIAALMVQVNNDPSLKVEEGLIRHIVLNMIRSFNKQFKGKYGQLIVCCDSRKYWRKEYFPFYKAHRRKDREESDHDWTMIFDILNRIREEIKGNLPYRVLNVEGAEADDIIAILSARHSPHEDILIISSDKDFLQLQKYKKVAQYSPFLKRFIRTDNPIATVREHIIRGDRGDGIPNFLSPDDCFIAGKRQKSINNSKLVEWVNNPPEDFCATDEMLRGFRRNETLVDFDHIPQDLSVKIVEEYENAKTRSKNDLLNYLIANKMQNLINVAGDF